MAKNAFRSQAVPTRASRADNSGGSIQPASANPLAAVPELLDQRSQAYQDYDTLMKGRPMEAGVRADGTWNSAVFQPNDDGTSAINPWIHANNMSPYRGEVAFKNYKGELETAPHYWADRKFSADLGMYGFNDISNRLKQLTEQYTTSLNEQTALSYANLGKQTGKSYVTSASEALRARLV